MHNRSTAIAAKTHFNIFSRGSQDMQGGTLGIVRRHQLEAAENVGDLYTHSEHLISMPPKLHAKTVERIQNTFFTLRMLQC